MIQYHNYIGIDIGKFNFVVSIHNKQKTQEFENTDIGINEFLKEYEDMLTDSLCVLETTGGYELKLLYALCSGNYAVHRADTRKVKNFIRSYGNAVKTDILDAKALAKYGIERGDSLELFQPQSKSAQDLFALVQRRTDLKKMSAAEKNRLQAPGSSILKDSCRKIILALEEQIRTITDQITEIINKDPILKKKTDILKTIPGIGEVISFELIVLLPELGKLSRRKIASLAGLAPIANESGKYTGYRKVGHGRSVIKPILFLAAMAARNSKTELKVFYEHLISKGKNKMVALTALMRKILVIANAKLKNIEIA
jgi:transposase